MEHLLTSLRNVTHLEFSLMTMKEHDAKEELSSILQLKIVPKEKETNVRKMYAEV